MLHHQKWWSSLGSLSLQDKQWTIHLTLSHHLKIYFCSFIFNIQQGTGSSHINFKTMQGKDFWTTNKNSSWLLSVMNSAGIYTSLWYAKLLKSILVKKKNATQGQSPGTVLERSYSCAQLWVLPKYHCSAAATRYWRSDKQVKNSLKNRDKNIPTSVKCGINITNTILCVPVSGQVWGSCLSGRKNEAEIEKECVCVWNTSCRNTMDFPPLLQCSAMIFLAHFCWAELGNHHAGRNCRNENSLSTSFFLRAGGTTQNKKLRGHV